tara:strand:- start:74 stop:382 length:309 start_codon:yes stop_codon:yes gene_type:complete
MGKKKVELAIKGGKKIGKKIKDTFFGKKKSTKKKSTKKKTTKKGKKTKPTTPPGAISKKAFLGVTGAGATGAAGLTAMTKDPYMKQTRPVERITKKRGGRLR